MILFSKRFKIIVIVCSLPFSIFISDLYSQSDKYITLSTVKARSIGMGGAFVSIEDDLASLDFNPASFSAKCEDDGVRLSFFTNGFCPVFAYRKDLNGINSLGLVLKGITLSSKRVQLGVLFGEESLFNTNRLERVKIFDTSNYEDNYNTSFGISVDLAAEVQIGIAGELFTRKIDGHTVHKMGYRYGLRLKTHNKITVGLFFIDLPNQFQNDRMVVERLADETLNVGFSYKPVKRFVFSLDVRNVTEENKGALREPHFGSELNIFEHLTLRGGFFYQKDSKTENYSAGLGIFNWNSLFSNERVFKHPQFLFDFAVVIQRQNSVINYWYIAQCILRI